MAVDVTNRVMSIKNQANWMIQQEVITEEINLRGFCDRLNTARMGGRLLRSKSYPYAPITFAVNRRGFKFEVGDVFKTTWKKYGIVEPKVFRILKIKEDAMDSEKLTIDAIEDLYYFAGGYEYLIDIYDLEQPTNPVLDVGGKEGKIKKIPTGKTRIIAINDSTDSNKFKFYIFALPRTGDESGYHLQYKIEDGSYQITDVDGDFCAGGVLLKPFNVAPVPYDWYDPRLSADINSGIGIYFTSQSVNIDQVVTITEEELFAYKNLALLVNNPDDQANLKTEIIGFQKIDGIPEGTGIPEDTWHLQRIWRGLYGTKIQDWPAGDNPTRIFIFEPLGGETLFEVDKGGKYKFKLLPYSGGNELDISDADAIQVNTGKALTDYNKYYIESLMANDEPDYPTYGAPGYAIELAWQDAVPAPSGSFSYNIYVKGVRNADGQVIIQNRYIAVGLIEDNEKYKHWIYTMARLRIDFSVYSPDEFPDEITFIVEPVSGGTPFVSGSITVKKEV